MYLISLKSVLIFVNNNQINVKIKDIDGAKLSVYNINGQLLQSTNLTNSFTQINTTFPSGIYIIEVQNANVITREKVIIK